MLTAFKNCANLFAGFSGGFQTPLLLSWTGFVEISNSSTGSISVARDLERFLLLFDLSGPPWIDALVATLSALSSSRSSSSRWFSSRIREWDMCCCPSSEVVVLAVGRK